MSLFLLRCISSFNNLNIRNTSEKDNIMYRCLGITLFFNEFELLFLQLKTLSRICDHIIVVEAECNWRGEPRKNLEYSHFLEKFEGDIKEISYEYMKIPKENFRKVNDLDLDRQIAFENEGMCRSHPIINNKADYYIYCDVDEIFSDGQIEEIKSLISGSFKGNKECRFWYHNYYLNWRCVYPRGWKRILCFMKSNPVIDQQVHLFDYESGQEFAIQFKGKRQRPQQTDIIKNIGYHFSYFYSLETKLKSIAHTELTNQVITAKKRKEQRTAAAHPKWKCKSIPVTDIQIQDLHENIKIFRPFIGP